MNGRRREGLGVGARAVSGVSRHEVEYGGMDVHTGPNVDVTGDAYALGEIFAPERFDRVFSLRVFEHLRCRG